MRRVYIRLTPAEAERRHPSDQAALWVVRALREARPEIPARPGAAVKS